MVTIVKTWETVFFHAERKVKDVEVKVQVEMTYNHVTGKYTLCTPRQEMISFNGDTILESELKLEAVSAALNYIKKIK